MSVEGPAEFRTKILKLIQQATLNPSGLNFDEPPKSSDFACVMIPTTNGGMHHKNTYHFEVPATITVDQASVLADIIKEQRINSLKFIVEKIDAGVTTLHYGPCIIQGGLTFPGQEFVPPAKSEKSEPNNPQPLIFGFNLAKGKVSVQPINPEAEAIIKAAFKSIKPLKEDLDRYENASYEYDLSSLGMNRLGARPKRLG